MKRPFAAAAAALVLAGCTNNAPVEEPNSPTTPVATTTPVETPASTITQTPTVDPASDEERAKQAVIDFWRLRDRLGSHPEESITVLAEVARGQALDVHTSSLFSQAQERLRQEGTGVVTPIDVQPGPMTNQFLVTACLDVSGVDVVDEEGRSVVPAGRADRSAYQYTVERDGDSWFLVEDLLEAKAC